MSRQSARDIRYGRRGGGWVDPPRPSAPARPGGPARAPVVLDPARLFHPETIATARAHARRTPGSCASDATPTTEPAQTHPTSAGLFDPDPDRHPETPASLPAAGDIAGGDVGDGAAVRAACDCAPDLDDLAAIWAGRARMAAARRAAGVELDRVDVEALDRRGER